MMSADYIQSSKLSVLLNDLADVCVRERSPCPASTIARAAQQMTEAHVVQNVAAREILNGLGSMTTEVEVSLMSGSEGTGAASSTPHLALHPSNARRVVLQTPTKGTSRLVEDADVLRRLTKALQAVRIGDLLAVDVAILQTDGTDNMATLTAPVCVAISIACAQAFSRAMRTPLALHIAAHHYGQDGMALYLPTPIVTLFGSDGRSAGKSRIREVCVFPLGNDVWEKWWPAVPKMYAFLQNKFAHSDTTPDGFLRHAAFDGLAAAVDVAEEALREAGLTPGQHAGVGMAFDAELCVRGEGPKFSFFEGSDTTGAFWAEQLAILARDRPHVLYLEDTHRDVDVADLQRLMHRCGATVTIAGNHLYGSRVEALKRGVAAKMTNNAVLRMNDAGTLTRVLTAADAFTRYAHATLTFHVDTVELNAEAAVHMAAAMGCRYLRVGGAMNHAHHARVANETMRLRNLLAVRGLLIPPPSWGAVDLPPPPTDPVPELTQPQKKRK